METLENNNDVANMQKLSADNKQASKPRSEQCMQEVTAILEKHNCQITCQRQLMYGQTIFVPVIEERK